MLEIQQLCPTASNTGIGSVQKVVAEFEFGTRRKKNIFRKRKHEQKFESGLLRNETQERDRGSLRKDRKQTYKNESDCNYTEKGPIEVIRYSK